MLHNTKMSYYSISVKLTFKGPQTVYFSSVMMCLPKINAPKAFTIFVITSECK